MICHVIITGIWYDRFFHLKKFVENDPSFVIHEFNIKQATQFIKDNLGDPNIIIAFDLFYFVSQESMRRAITIINMLNTLPTEKVKSKIIFFVHDFWFGHNGIHDTFSKKVFCAKNHYAHTVADSVTLLNQLHSTNYDKYSKHIICCRYWPGMDEKILPFNDDPIVSVAIAGRTYSDYPERMRVARMANGKTVTRLAIRRESTHTGFSHRLHKYICCFVASVRDTKKRRTHCIVMKVFETLACGSLLLTPKIEEPYYNKMGLVHKQNCYLCPMKGIKKHIAYILDPKNREEIDTIRKNGQEFAKKYYSSQATFDRLKKELFDVI